jgi:hypothetical protein
MRWTRVRSSHQHTGGGNIRSTIGGRAGACWPVCNQLCCVSARDDNAGAWKRGTKVRTDKEVILMPIKIGAGEGI